MTDLRFKIQNFLQTSCRVTATALKHPILVSSLLIASFVLGTRYTGSLQSMELLMYDQMMRQRSDISPDDRLLIVTITEEDFRKQKRYPVSDQVVAQLIAKLQQYQPRVIGLDVYRDVPQPPGHPELLRQLQAPNVITVKLLGDAENNSIPAPAGIPQERVGFSDIVLDGDSVVRRSLLFANTKSERLYAFSLRASLAYLAKDGISMTVEPTSLMIGSTPFRVLDRLAGAYQNLDDRGYQVLLNYRSIENVARQVSLTQVLEGNLNPEWVQDKLVLIGTTAPSAKDLFATPYSFAAEKSPKIPGVMIHAQATSQVLSTVLEQRPLFWFWAEPLEMGWVLGWALMGGMLAWRLRHPGSLGIAIVGAIGGLFGICSVIFIYAGWVPFMPAAIALVGTGMAVVVYRMLHDAFHDALTALPNRALFMKQLQWAIAKRANRRSRDLDFLDTKENAAIAVLFLGLDSFKAINDSFGHRLGDQLLAATARRLKTCLHPTDQLARVGGDEFAVLRRDIRHTEEVTHLADQLQQQVTIPFRLSGQEVFTTASVGIVLDRRNSNYQPEDILRDAHTALNRAKASGKARHEVFVTGMRIEMMTRMQLETDLRRALERQELHLHYQPLIALKTGKIAGFEALLRWHHPQRGFIPPIEFIPVAEETDLIIPIGQWIIEAACRQLKTWQEQFPKKPALHMSINLSGKQFGQPDLVERIEQTLQETGLEGHSLKMEITESIAMTDVESTIAVMLRLKALNLQLSIDDFGTGYSSLSYLHRFPTSTIKVDRSFVSRMGYESEDAHIVQTIVLLGHNLGMEIVAEGIETSDQLASLRKLDCEYGQGYFFAKPLSPEAMVALLKTDPHW